MKINLSHTIYVLRVFFFLIFAMSHHRTNLWDNSVKIEKKNNETIDEFRDPFYFLKTRLHTT